MWLHITALELLDTAPLHLTDTTEQAGPADAEQDHAAEQDDVAAPASSTLSDHGSLERYGPYIVWSDPDTAADTVWTETGELLGTAVYPATASDIIHAHQRRTHPGT
jgi:hypothetical protein